MSAAAIEPAADSIAMPTPMQTPAEPPHGLSPSFWQIVRGRRSIRRYLPTPIPRRTLEALLTAASWAPSAHNRQPWRFCVMVEPAGKLALSRRMGERWRADLAADGATAEVVERRVTTSHARLTGAPALIVPCVCMEEMDAYPDAVRSHAEWLMAVQSVALACQNLLLAAHDAGLGACWLCAPLFAPELVRDVLDLPAHWEPQAIITVGYPAEERERERAPLTGSAARVVWR